MQSRTWCATIFHARVEVRGKRHRKAARHTPGNKHNEGSWQRPYVRTRARWSCRKSRAPRRSRVIAIAVTSLLQLAMCIRVVFDQELAGSWGARLNGCSGHRHYMYRGKTRERYPTKGPGCPREPAADDLAPFVDQVEPQSRFRFDRLRRCSVESPRPDVSSSQ